MAVNVVWASSYSSNSTPSLGTSICHGSGSRKGKKTKKKNESWPSTFKISLIFGVPFVAQWLTNLTKNHEVAGLILGLAQRVKDPALP